jgi:hypothetical protein
MENVAAGQNGDLRMHQGLLQSGLPSLVTVLKSPVAFERKMAETNAWDGTKVGQAQRASKR